MPQTVNLELDDLPCTVQRSARRRRTIALCLQPGGELRVLAPAGLSLKKIENFLRQRTGWVRRKRESLRKQRPPELEESIKNGGHASFQGAACLLRITQEKARRAECHFRDGEININIPDDSLSPAALGEEARLELRLWYKKQARLDFQERLIYWSARLGVSYGRLIVTSPERRWGSCSARNDIRLNWRLIMAPPELADYVAAHELCHVVHKNHARAFWRCLGAVMPDYALRRRQLREWERRGSPSPPSWEERGLG